jgi:tetratricopeptide (TPR) repeat protein
MLPPTPVLTNGNCGVRRMYCLLVTAACVWISGCTPPGPSALLQGKQLLDEGRYADAVPKLEKAASLLPKNALAWNYLGLAYHGNGQFEPAANAYRTALSLDHKLMVVRYNLGCLYLERDNLAAAMDELKSYTLLRPAALEGWLKLGTAQLRARRLEEAEKSFRTALDLHAKHPEALNGLGLVQVQRRRWQDALNHFNVAALQDPPFAPALLNSAVIQHQYLNNRSVALQRYRQYLSLQPRPADWESVESTARQLEQELNPAPIASRAALAPPAALASTKTNSPPPPGDKTPRTVTPLPASVHPAPARTNVPSLTTLPKTSAPSAVPSTNALAATTRPPPESARPPIKPPAPKSGEVSTAKPATVEVTQVQSDLVLKPAQELTRNPSPPLPEAPAVDRTAATNETTNGAKRGLLARLNPFGGKPKAAPATPAAEPVAARGNDPSPPLAGVTPRYTYLSPAAPTAGNRAESEKAFKRGLKAQKGGNRAEAVTEYQAAVKTDPANYDAYYNLGLAALGGGDTRLSLWAYEIALALKPDAEDARYNFALALKAGGYWLDACDQLQKLLAENSSDARAHLSLGNLYSQQLEQPHLAREHYVRVLELNPRHVEAPKIRYWLAANP